MNFSSLIRLLLGVLSWSAACSALAGSIYTVRQRSARPTHTLRLQLDPGRRLAPGDLVYLQSSTGLQRIGEIVGQVDGELVEAAVRPDCLCALNASTHATCWQTPLSAEEAIDALLPPSLQQVAADLIAADWRVHEQALADAWGPLAAELGSALLATVGADLEAAFRRREAELRDLARWHAEACAAAWPAIEQRLRPILQEHLNPVLSRLLNAAVADAPKMEFALNVARGGYAEAFQHMLDWLMEYLADLPPADEAELEQAVQRAWEAARNDAVLVEKLSALGRGVVDDARLRRVLSDIYREALGENPRIAEFLRRQIIESPVVREQFYAFVERFAPTARRVAALCLFDDQGATRPEIVHLVRSVALRREVAWVALETVEVDAPMLPPRAVLRARSGGARR
ncbi:MAG: hypothetical protein HY763_14890 [Planctomycetes bacterium]|nr:hypothetical protein [Planctomycetota bacterium]